MGLIQGETHSSNTDSESNLRRSQNDTDLSSSAARVDSGFRRFEIERRTGKLRWINRLHENDERG